MADLSPESGSVQSESGAESPKKKRTCLVCGCIGCLAAFIIVGTLSVIFSGFMIELLRSLFVSTQSI